MLRPEQLTTHPFLQRVGPDVLDSESDAGGGKGTVIVTALS